MGFIRRIVGLASLLVLFVGMASEASVICKVGSPVYYVNGVRKISSHGLKPQLIGGTIHLPGEFLTESQSKRVLCQRVAGEQSVLVNADSVMIPLRKAAEHLGCKVSYADHEFAILDFTGRATLTPIVRAQFQTKPSESELLERFERRFEASVVKANLLQKAPVFPVADPTQTPLARLSKGAKVEILKDLGTEWYLVQNRSGTRGWVHHSNLAIPGDSLTLLDPISKEDWEWYLNRKGIGSKTHYLIWVDIPRQLTYVFSGSQGHWKLNKTFSCSTGKNVSPTIRGRFTVRDRGKWFYSERFKSGGKYWLMFQDSYLFHSIPLDKDQNVIVQEAHTLGKKASHGCVRLSLEDSKWMHEHIPIETSVFIR